MKALNRAIDRFCYKHPRFGIPNLMLFVVIGNILVFLFTMMDRTGFFSSYLTFSAAGVFQRGEVWRLLTFILVPNESNIFFLALFLYFYYFIGRTLERQWGAGKFTIYYFSGILLTLLYGTVVWLITGVSYGLTASYVNLSMFFAFATLYPDARFLLIIIPVKAKWLAWLDAAVFIWTIIQYLFSGYPLLALIPVIAILNYLLFFASDFARLFGRVKYKTSRQTINFKKAQKQARETKGYIHKCAVCGITDADDPNMEFRYCSKCNGYYCYCMDHINNHVHIE